MTQSRSCASSQNIFEHMVRECVLPLDTNCCVHMSVMPDATAIVGNTHTAIGMNMFTLYPIHITHIVTLPHRNHFNNKIIKIKKHNILIIFIVIGIIIVIRLMANQSSASL